MRKNILWNVTICIATFFFCKSTFAQSIQMPDLPQNLCEIPIVMPDTVGYNRITVGKGSGYDYNEKQLQHVIDSVEPGTIILLGPDTFYVPHEANPGVWDAPWTYTFKNKSNPNNKWIVLMPILYNYLPGDGVRLDPEAPTGNSTYPKVRDVLPKFPSSYKVYGPWETETSSNHYYVVGFDCFLQKDYFWDHDLGALMELGNGGSACCTTFPMDSLYEVPQYFVIDRCFFHLDPRTNSKFVPDVHAAIRINCGRTAVVNCYLKNIVRTGFEGHGIAGWNGTGPFRIINNYIEASGVNFMWGGSWHPLPTAGDLEFRNNHCIKLPQWEKDSPGWDSSNYCIKNHFELKVFKRALIEGNILENNWNGGCEGQRGYSIVLTSRTAEVGPFPDNDEYSDITIRNNYLKNTEAGFIILGADDYDTSATKAIGNKLLIENNIFAMKPERSWASIFFVDWPTNAVFDHNTFINHGFVAPNYIIKRSSNCNKKWSNFSYTNNICYHVQYGFRADTGTTYIGVYQDALTTAWDDLTDASLRFNKNVMVDNFNSYYNGPAFLAPKWANFNTISQNYVPLPADFAFVDSANGRSDIRNFALANGSPYKNAGSDGKDIGADVFKIYDIITLGYKDTCSNLMGIKESKNISKDLVVYPNPARSQLTVEVSRTNNNQNLQIIDLTGRIVLEETIVQSKTSININKLCYGMYILRYGDATKKLIIE